MLKIKEMKKRYIACSLLVLFLAGIGACKKLLPPAPADEEILDGPVEGLTSEQKIRFLEGDRAFNDEVFTAETGLGPYFVANSCGSCHAGDGKGHPFTTLTRFGQADTNGNTYMNSGGPQLQNRAIPGFAPETVPAGASFSKFTPPANTGLGFLELLTDAQIIANADPNDLNGDGISGVANYVSPPAYFIPKAFHTPVNGKYIGRFGKKAAAIDLWHQTVNAYVQDMGVTSEYATDEPYINGVQSPYGDPAPDPEVASSRVQNVIFYLRTLKAPVQRNKNNADVIAGKQTFVTIGCEKCHKAEWTTGKSDIEALSYKTFYPYTDLLLHDMGAGLNDGYTEGKALTSEWKTPPLWGLGLSKNSQGGKYYLMHDGRATSIEQAIQLHGGEAQNSNNAFQALSQNEKDNLIKFLESL
ncbi:MAG: thiol oxidoreductase [Bacteroidetes bacterium]|nr:thiol oxidoreductase [Bacteroidota bacterium]